ncbi:MAG: F0F1 ATP synthase subunit delta [Gammaproteobacteria bacterium]|nr:F0F1 ATP synthase subunit delta [Gammaproteobacteria bacterium]
MAESITLARPYAKAAFATAMQANALSHWSRMLTLAAAVAGNAKVHNRITTPTLDANEIAQSMIDLCGDELDQGCQNFIRLLAKNKRLVLLPQISQLYEVFKANQEKSVDVEITTAFEISAAVTTKLAQALKTRLQRDIKMVTRVNQALIGGAVIRAGDTVIDSSVRGKLSKLAESMKS